MELGPDTELDPAVDPPSDPLADLQPGDDRVSGDDRSLDRGVAAK